MQTNLLPGPDGWTLARCQLDESRLAAPHISQHRHHHLHGRLCWTRPSDGEPGMVHALRIDRNGDYGGCYAIAEAGIFTAADGEA